MRDLAQIIRDNGADDTPALDTHNLTGRAFPEGVEPEWTPYETFLGNLDWAEDRDTAYDLGYLGDECG